MIKILVLGQTPPPYGGQAIMIESILNIHDSSIKLYHIRMSFSANMSEVGIVKIAKIFHTIKIICLTYFYRFKYNIQILYYPPAGPDIIPILRDILILLFIRPLFKKTIFHFHAGGLSEYLIQLKNPLKLLSNCAYKNPTMTIRLSDLNPEDGKYLNSEKEIVVPNGIEDNLLSVKKKLGSIANEIKNIIILYVGVIKLSKGVETLLATANTILKKTNKFKIRFVGQFESKQYENYLLDSINNSRIRNNIEFVGVKTGIDKFIEYYNADIFCFPTFFESETFGIVLLEAMQFELPIVATNWRAIPSIIRNNKDGFIVPIKNSNILAQKLIYLIQNPSERERMGKNARCNYLKNYTSDKFQVNMVNVFKST